MQLVGLRVGFKEFGDDFFGDEFHEGSGLRELGFGMMNLGCRFLNLESRVQDAV